MGHAVYFGEIVNCSNHDCSNHDSKNNNNNNNVYFKPLSYKHVLFKFEMNAQQIKCFVLMSD